MKTITHADWASQGEIMIIPVEAAVPEDAEKIEPVNGRIILAHSETGHHHVMSAETATLYDLPANEKTALPEAITECLLVLSQPTVLEHLRSFDTHEPQIYEPGTYRVRHAREYTPAGLRRVED